MVVHWSDTKKNKAINTLRVCNSVSSDYNLLLISELDSIRVMVSLIYFFLFSSRIIMFEITSMHKIAHKECYRNNMLGRE